MDTYNFSSATRLGRLAPTYPNLVYSCDCSDTSTHVTGMMDEQELHRVTRLITLDHYMKICTTLGWVSTQTTPSEDAVVTVLMAWQQSSPNNRRLKLARILMSMGCYRAALKLDAKCKQHNIYTSTKFKQL